MSHLLSNRYKRSAKIAQKARYSWAFWALPLALIVASVSLLDFHLGYEQLSAHLLTGETGGGYHQLGAQLERRARRGGGRIENLSTAGSLDNLERLMKADESGCHDEFALAQAGVLPKNHEGLQYIGQMPGVEIAGVVTRETQPLESWAEFSDKTVASGRPRSGTNELARQLFDLRELETLNITSRAMGREASLAAVLAGEVDAALIVQGLDSPLFRKIARTPGLKFRPLPDAGALARRLNLGTATIEQGQLHLVRELPQVQREYLALPTMIFAASCANRGDIMKFMSLITDEFPSFIDHNRQNLASSNLPHSEDATEFFAQGGPGFLERHLPWLGNWLRPGQWMYLLMTISVLFNAMNGLHRFRLWRIDAARVDLESRIPSIIGEDLTSADIEEWQGALDEKHRGALESLISEFYELTLRCRKLSVSTMVPMGAEMSYRYQEEMMEQRLSALKRLLSRVR